MGAFHGIFLFIIWVSFFFVIIKNIKFIDNVNKFMVKYIKEKCHPKNNPFLLLVRLTKVIH